MNFIPENDMVGLNKLLEKLEIDENSEEWKISKAKIELSIMIIEILKELKDIHPDIYEGYKNITFDELDDNKDIYELVSILFDLFMNMGR